MKTHAPHRGRGRHPAHFTDFDGFDTPRRGPPGYERGAGASPGPGHGHGGPHGRRGGRSRLFDYGELRLLVLALIAQTPAHGYELIKGIEERFGGAYSPSPGVIYPTLSWLVDMGYAVVADEAGGRKRYSIAPDGEAFLTTNRAAADQLLSRSVEGLRGRAGTPAPVLRAMENLKAALRLRIGAGTVDPAGIDAIAAAIDDAATAITRL